MTDRPRRRRSHAALGARIVSVALGLGTTFGLVAVMTLARSGDQPVAAAGSAAPEVRRRPLVVVVHHPAPPVATTPPAGAGPQPTEVRVRRVVRTAPTPTAAQPVVRPAAPRPAAPVATSNGSR